MTGRKPAIRKKTGAERVIGLSDEEFEKWLDSLEHAGLTLKAK